MNVVQRPARTSQGDPHTVASPPSKQSTSLTRLYHRSIYLRDLVSELVGRDMKLRYRRSLLGVAWSLLNPLLQLLVFGFVFRYVLPLDVPNYTLFLFIGLLVWSWFQSSLNGATTAIIDGSSLIKRPGFPAAILPAVTVCANLTHFLLALPILLIFLLLAKTPLTPALLLLPLVILLQFALTLSLAYFLATVHVTFRDAQHLVAVFLLLFFYLTPVFYEVRSIPESLQTIYHLNPMLHVLDAYRSILLNGKAPSFLPLGVLTLVSTILLYVGYKVFMRASYRFAEEL